MPGPATNLKRAVELPFLRCSTTVSTLSWWLRAHGPNLDFCFCKAVCDAIHARNHSYDLSLLLISKVTSIRRRSAVVPTTRPWRRIVAPTPSAWVPSKNRSPYKGKTNHETEASLEVRTILSEKSESDGNKITNTHLSFRKLLRKDASWETDRIVSVGISWALSVCTISGDANLACPHLAIASQVAFLPDPYQCAPL